MSWATGTATDHGDLLNKLDTFLTSQGMTTSPLYAGTGNGVISGLIGGSASIAENITVAMTSATAFSVTGSTSGSLGTGTVGVAFTGTKVNFTITAGGVAFIAGDTWTFSTTPAWTSKRRVAGSEMIWQAPGNGGLNQILVGALVFTNTTADYYNWRMGGFTAFDGAVSFINQAGYVGGAGQAHPSPVLTLWNNPMTYWFVANGRRVIIVAKVSSVYVIGYLGFLNSYVSPNVFPYPLCVGGNLNFVSSEPVATSVNWRWSYTGTEMQNCSHNTNSNSGTEFSAQLQLRLASGQWHSFIRSSDNANTTPLGHVWPYGVAAWTNWAKNLDGGYSMLPIVLGDVLPVTPNMWGELDGLEAISGVSNGSENTVTIGNSIYLVVQNVFRTTQVDFAAVKLI